MTSARRLSVMLVLTCVTVLATGCNLSVTFDEGIDGSGDLVTQRFDLDDFDSIEVSGTFDAFVTVGQAFSVEVLIDDNLVDELDIRVRNGDLRIAMKSGVSVDSGTLEATVQIPTLVELDVSGASSAVVTDNTGADQRYSVSGASNVEATSVAAAITVDVEGTSDVTITGIAQSVSVVASGASNLDLELDQVDMAMVDLAGATSLELQSADSVTGSMSGASDLTLPVGSRTDIDSSGASEVRRR